MNKKLVAHIAILGANIIFGVNYSIAKPIMPDYVQPFGLVFLRIFGALTLFWVAGFWIKESIEKSDAIRLFFCALFGVFTNQVLFISGLNFTTPIDASIILVSNPILVLIAASIILNEKITFLKGLGIFLGALGALLLILQGGNADFSSEHFRGNIMVFINAASYGVFLVLVKPLMSKYHPITVMKWIFLLGSVFIFPIGISQVNEINWIQMPVHIIISVLFVILGTTFLAYLLNIFAMKQVSPTTVSTYIYLQPVIASITAIIMGQDQLNTVKIVSTIIIFVGVYLVSQPKALFKRMAFINK